MVTRFNCFSLSRFVFKKLKLNWTEEKKENIQKTTKKNNCINILKHVAYNEQPNSNGQHEWIEMRDSIAKQDICIQWTIQKLYSCWMGFHLFTFSMMFLFFLLFFFVAVLFLNSV